MRVRQLGKIYAMSEERRPYFEKVGGVAHFMHPCNVCGAHGCYGFNVKLRQAMNQRNAALAGEWYCVNNIPEKFK